MTSTSCYPWWHAKLANAPKTIVSSGCPTVNGNVQCDPEAMRANAEAQLAAAGYLDGALTLEMYTLARYMESEVGSRSPEAQVAVGEAAVNRAKIENKASVNNILLYRQQPSSPNYGYYGPIHGGGGYAAPYGRWAATSRDPSVAALMTAQMILNGDTDNFNRGADDQDGLEHTGAFPDPAYKVRFEAAKGSYWVGPLPGIDHWQTFLWRKYGMKPDTEEGAALLQRGLEAVADRSRMVWGDLPLCSKPILKGKGPLIAALGGIVLGAWLTTRHIKLPWSRK